MINMKERNNVREGNDFSHEKRNKNVIVNHVHLCVL